MKRLSSVFVASLWLTLPAFAAPDPALIPPVMREWMAAEKGIGSIKVAFHPPKTPKPRNVNLKE